MGSALRGIKMTRSVDIPRLGRSSEKGGEGQLGAASRGRAALLHTWRSFRSHEKPTVKLVMFTHFYMRSFIGNKLTFRHMSDAV